MLSQNEIKEWFTYKDGGLYWRQTSGCRGIKGRRAGRVCLRGYRDIKFRQRIYKEHRLVFMLFWGYVPAQLDHRNRIKHDNRIENLRGCNSSLNSGNEIIRKTNTSGYRGVSRTKSGRWMARLGIKGGRRYIGTFGTKLEAINAFNARAKEVFGDFVPPLSTWRK